MIEKKHFLEIRNFSRLGCTISQGIALIEKRLKKEEPLCDAVIIDYGGNDCDFKWQEIADCPDGEHLPNTPIDGFVNMYHKIIRMLNEKRIRPILTTLPPLYAQKFFDWFCKGLNKENVLKWLGSVETIYRWQEYYSRTVEKIAAETNTLLVDVRGAFLKHRRIEHLLCEDGTHPNTEGQKIITQAFLEFIETAKTQGKILNGI
jgi:lysophospholipase L1-like esterase